jgi:hypothetical protein
MFEQQKCFTLFKFDEPLVYPSILNIALETTECFASYGAHLVLRLEAEAHYSYSPQKLFIQLNHS